MFTFKSFLTEVGQFSYPFEKTGYMGSGENKTHVYHFTDEKDNPTKVEITHYKNKKTGKTNAEVSFLDPSERPGRRVDASGKKGYASVKTFSTINNIMRAHQKENPHVDEYSFTSAAHEKSRGSLYNKFANKLGGSSKMTADGLDVIHKIPAKSFS